jgi:murein DD-endopeptidase MepM/ murein hydrolase activator NlpD
VGSQLFTDAFVLGRPARHVGRKAVIAAVTAVLVWSSLASSPTPPQASASDPAVARLENHIRSVNDRIREHRAAARDLRIVAQRLGARKQIVQRELHRARKADRRDASANLSRAAMRDRDDAARLALHGRREQLVRQRSGIVTRVDQHHRVIGQLARLRVRLDAQLWRIRPIGVCPVRGPVSIADDFGAARYVDGKYDHPHQGNDILAPLGAEILAPFDGRAAVASNSLGGMSVKVFGEAGYVYNAHLSRLGKLGEVQAGDVIGYVGTSGNAQGTTPHNHFEWHPGGGSAVDPHALLDQVC